MEVLPQMRCYCADCCGFAGAIPRAPKLIDFVDETIDSSAHQCPCFECQNGADCEKKILLSLILKTRYPSIVSPIVSLYPNVRRAAIMMELGTPREYNFNTVLAEKYFFVTTIGVELTEKREESHNLCIGGKYYGFLNFEHTFSMESYFSDLNGKILRKSAASNLWNCDDCETPAEFRAKTERCYGMQFRTDLMFNDRKINLLCPVRAEILNQILNYRELYGFRTDTAATNEIDIVDNDVITREEGFMQSVIKCREYFLGQMTPRPKEYFKITYIYCLRCDKYINSCQCSLARLC